MLLFPCFISPAATNLNDLFCYCIRQSKAEAIILMQGQQRKPTGDFADIAVQECLEEG